MDKDLQFLQSLNNNEEKEETKAPEENEGGAKEETSTTTETKVENEGGEQEEEIKKTDETTQSDTEEKQEGGDKEESSLKSEEKTSKTEGDESKQEKPEEKAGEAKQEEEPVTDEDVVSYLNEYFGEDRFSSIDDLKPQEHEYANETVKEIDQYLKDGGTLQNYVDFKLTDYDKMENLDVIKAKMKREYPNLSDEKINNKLKRTYKLDEEKYDEDEVAAGREDLEFDAENAKKYFNDLKGKYASPVNQTADQKEQQKSEKPEVSEEEAQEFVGALNENLEGLKSIDFNNGFSYEVDGKIKESVGKKSIDIGDWFLDKKNKFNHGEYNKLRVIAADIDGFVESAIEQGKTKALKEIKEKRNNVDLGPEEQGNKPRPDKQKAQEEILKLYKGQSGFQV